MRNPKILLIIVISLISMSSLYGRSEVFYPVVDTELLMRDDGSISVEPDGQWWPNVMYRESPENETQFAFEFDLGAIGGERVLYAEFHYYIQAVTAIDQLELETWIYNGDSQVTESDFERGDTKVDTLSWSSPTPGSERIETQLHVRVNVTRQVRAMRGDEVGLNLRLAGGIDDGFDGNVFVDGYNEHMVQLAAGENWEQDGAIRPSLTIYLMPEQDENAWQMKQKDIHHTGRAAYWVPADRLNDTFFDDIVWQVPTTGAFNGSGFAYYDGAGPDGGDIAVCTNTWQNKVTGVDRHTGKLFWQDTPGGGDIIGKMTAAFSNDGTKVYASTEVIADRIVGFWTQSGPGGGFWGNSSDVEPRNLSILSPTVAPDGRIFAHRWNEACYAGEDRGGSINQVWAASEGVSICNSDTTLFEDEGQLNVIQTGRAGRIMVFDGNSGDEIWRVQTYQGTDCSATVDPENGNIYYGAGVNYEFYVVGLDKDGNSLWDKPMVLLNDSGGDSAKLENARSSGCLSHDGRTYYVQSMGQAAAVGKLYAINTADGSLRWSYETHCQKDPSADYSSSPIVTENGVLVLGNVMGGEYLGILDVGDHGRLLDSIMMEPEWNDESKRQAKASAVISADGMLYLPLRTAWTVGYEEGPEPNGEMKYCLAGFDLSGCDGVMAADLNGDCIVNLLDFMELVNSWMVCNRQPESLCW